MDEHCVKFTLPLTTLANTSVFILALSGEIPNSLFTGLHDNLLITLTQVNTPNVTDFPPNTKSWLLMLVCDGNFLQ